MSDLHQRAKPTRSHTLLQLHGDPRRARHSSLTWFLRQQGQVPNDVVVPLEGPPVVLASLIYKHCCEVTPMGGEITFKNMFESYFLRPLMTGCSQAGRRALKPLSKKKLAILRQPTYSFDFMHIRIMSYRELVFFSAFVRSVILQSYEILKECFFNPIRCVVLLSGWPHGPALTLGSTVSDRMHLWLRYSCAMANESQF